VPEDFTVVEVSVAALTAVEAAVTAVGGDVGLVQRKWHV
jgi:hypothetical protein